MNEQLTLGGDYTQPTMTVKEVAESLDVTEKTVLKYAAMVVPNSIRNGVKTLLSEVDATAIKLKLQQNQHLEHSVKLPKTDLEKELIIQQAMLFQAEKIKSLQEKLTEAQPKIKYYDQVKDSEGLHTVAESAKMLGTGRNRLFQWMRLFKILRDNNEPYQQYINAGYFEVKEVYYNGCINFQTFITPTGLQWLQKRREKSLDEVTEWADKNQVKLRRG